MGSIGLRVFLAFRVQGVGLIKFGLYKAYYSVEFGVLKAKGLGPLRRSGVITQCNASRIP